MHGTMPTLLHATPLVSPYIIFDDVEGKEGSDCSRKNQLISNEVLRAIHVALLCTQGSPHQRPSMSRAVSMLAGDDVEVGEVVNKPSYITEWQIKGGNTSSFMSSNMSGQSSLAPRAASSHTSSPFIASSVIEKKDGDLQVDGQFSVNARHKRSQDIQLLHIFCVRLCAVIDCCKENRGRHPYDPFGTAPSRLWSPLSRYLYRCCAVM
ncbi:hypothetical protein SEVIR_7G249200v4 [Setaria viridis]|uniref:Uncharacterized protein n=1 Tax=Setaria viridis TaxID=4556 RepID=A0A4U6TZ55_SETVI|nr:uncharacterized protein LOC117862647 [Setaria viridis]TKW06583.1 hypothetical protein SEVIR_7G249200v2 [Setaria viridis]